MTDYARLSKSKLVERLIDSEGKFAALARSAAGGRAASALSDSRERIRGIVDTAVEGIITIDERGIIETVNPAAEKMFGYKAGEILGKNVNVLMPSPYRQEHDRYVANYVSTGHAKIIGIGREVLGRRKNGSIFPMDLSVGEMRLRGGRMFTGIVRDITERKRLEEEIIAISGREQQRIGQDLHDDLCQRLAAIELMSRALEQKLEKKSRSEAAEAAKIAEYIRDAISQTRMLARGLSPVELEANGLMSALEELASNTEQRFKISCEFQCDERVLIDDNTVGTHLYRIAQEAINNAVKHGRATRVTISLGREGDKARLIVTDDGKGFSGTAPGSGGMGLRIMKFRAGVIGGSLDIRRANGCGTRVACSFRKHP